MTDKITKYPANYIPALGGKNSCARALSSISANKSLEKDLSHYITRVAETKSRNLASKQGLAPKSKGFSLDGILEYSNYMKGRTNRRREVKQYFDPMKRLRRSISENTIEEPMRLLRKSLSSSKMLTPKSQRFSVDIAVLGSYINKDGSLIVSFQIGEHIMKPNFEMGRTRKPDAVNQEKWDQMINCGIMRPSMQVDMQIIQTTGGRIGSIKILVPLNEYNTDQPEFMVKRNGGKITNSFNAYHRGDDSYVHPHMRSTSGDYGRVWHACMGTFTDPMISAIHANNYNLVCDLIIRYMTSFDLQDGWGYEGAVAMCKKRLLAECEPERPVWMPVFTISPESGAITIMNKVADFDYGYTVLGMSEEGGKVELGSFNTSDESPVVEIPEGANFNHFKITTDQGQNKTIAIGRRR